MPKKFEHILSIQVNELLRQIINLDSDNDVINNPYLINYSFIHNKSKFGLQAGIGYDFENSEDKESPANKHSELHDLNSRIGITRKFSLGNKFYVFSGLDFVKKYKENTTVASTVVENSSSRDSTMNETSAIDEGYGGGIQIRLGWDISKFITLSTEATFYYMSMSHKEHVMVSNSREFFSTPQNNSYTIAATNSHLKFNDFKIVVPVAIFLGVKF